MLKRDDVLYFSSVETNLPSGAMRVKNPFWDTVLKQVPWDGQWYVRMNDKVPPNRMVTRRGEWTMPWPQEIAPKFAMPPYDPNFNKSFAQVTDETAIGIKHRVQNGERFAVMWSGGIDSTLVLSSLIKNLTDEEMKSIVVMCNIESMVENPTFYRKFVHGKLNVMDSGMYKYDDMIRMGLTPITADEGDPIFGTLIGLGMYNNFDALASKVPSSVRDNVRALKSKISDPNIHFSKFKDLIIQYFDIPWDARFGRIFYEKCVRNVETSDVPIHSLHDFFWWLIFNVKYINCSIRGAVYYNDTLDVKTAIHTIFNWYNERDYQLWSMANNNNGLKIKDSILSYKNVAKDYIYELDKNEWYHSFKTKLISMNNVSRQQNLNSIPVNKMPPNRVAIKKDGWELVYTGDEGVEDYFVHHLSSYKIDWTDV